MVDWTSAFWDGWGSVYRCFITALVMYPVVIVAIRVNGVRSVSKMNNFDWVVTVALGSLVASAIAFESVTILDAVVAIALLLGLQHVITGWMARDRRVEELFVASPTILLRNGAVQHDALQSKRISEAELMSALRHSGLSGPEDAYMVVLESNADFTVIPASDARPAGRAVSMLDG